MPMIRMEREELDKLIQQKEDYQEMMELVLSLSEMITRQNQELKNRVEQLMEEKMDLEMVLSELQMDEEEEYDEEFSEEMPDCDCMLCRLSRAVQDEEEKNKKQIIHMTLSELFK